MIKLQKYTPQVYYNHSRDFQFIGRLYDMVLNSVKTNTDLIYSLPLSDDSYEKLLDLMMMTFGFQSKHNYNIQQLKALCSAFALVIRNKGNITSIIYACNALVGAEGITEPIYVDEVSERNKITLYIPQELSDTNLLRDLLTYILPAGMSFELVKMLKKTITNTTELLVTAADVKTTLQHSSITSQIRTSLDGTIGPNSSEYHEIDQNRPGTIPGAIENTLVISSYKTTEDPYINPASPDSDNDNENDGN